MDKSQSTRPDQPKRLPVRNITLYDAVAGRVSDRRFLSSRPQTGSARDTLTSSTVAAPPEKVLARLKGVLPRLPSSSPHLSPASASQEREPQIEGLAPRSGIPSTSAEKSESRAAKIQRVEETYFANEHLPPVSSCVGEEKGKEGNGLPDSDLLKAIHAYASDYYARTIPSCTLQGWSNIHSRSDLERKRKRTEAGADESVEDDKDDEPSPVQPASDGPNKRNRTRKGHKMVAWPSTASLDETALLALGILLEESCLQALGTTGDLALTEGEPVHPCPVPGQNQDLEQDPEQERDES